MVVITLRKKEVFIWFLLLISAFIAQAREVRSMIKLPHNPKATSHCYESIKTARPPYRDAVAQIRVVIESQSLFREKLDKVLALHQQALNSQEDTEAEFVQIDVLLCCLYDMLQALYADEAEKILANDADKNEKKKALDALASSIEGLPFGSPQYRTGIRPKLLGIVASAQKKLK